MSGRNWFTVERENERLDAVARILCGHFSPHPWGAVADGKRELRLLVRRGGRDINEPTKEDLFSAAFDVLVHLRDSDGTATAAACEDMPVPQDRQARAEGIAQGDPQ